MATFYSVHSTTSSAALKPTLAEVENEILTIKASAWRDIGRKLKVPEMELDKLDEMPISIKDRRTAMLKSWLENDDKASWSTLAQALEGMYGTMASRIRSNHCGMWLTSCTILMGVLVLNLILLIT